MSFHKPVFMVVLFAVFMTNGCTGKESPSSVPSDFAFMMDVRAAKNDLPGNIHVNIKIDATGEGRFEYYDSGSSISYDLSDIVTYKPSQVTKSGKFKLTGEKLETLWNLLNENRFFELDEHYQMQIGYSYAFLMVDAKKKRHIVDNIGMEVPEIKAIVEATRTILPQEVNFEYGKGWKP